MKINPSIFKAYDIRGVYPQELNEDVASLIGKAFVRFLKNPKLNIVVARDNRLSSPALHKELIKGLTSMGADVIDIGLSTTPMFYFTVAHYGYDGGIMVTASHNPKEYNGFKMVRANATPISGESGIKDIQRMAQLEFKEMSPRGKVIKKEVLGDYLDFNLEDADGIGCLELVVDTANTVSGLIIPEIFNKVHCRVEHLFKESDGSFPNHPPDPSKKENLKTLQNKVIEKKADLGISFDGDGDRIIFVSEKGEIISGDLITALLATLILKDHPGEKISYDIRSSNAVKEAIEEYGGIPVVSRIGHSFIKEAMRKENIFFAGELTGHYYHKDHYFCEAPIFILLKILKEISKVSISKLIKPHQKYFHSGELNFQVKDKKAALERLKNRYSSGKISELDGLRVDFADWWFLARPSNTELILRLVIEAKTKSLMEEKKKELIALFSL